jgi:dipeptidyl aminopeptidase/acylaminoacyl peptidase
MTPTDIRRQIVVEELDLAGDGSTAVMVRRIIERGTYLGHLHTKSLDTGGRPNQITSGRVRDTSPRISPDGLQVAFLRSSPDHDDIPTRLCTMPLAGGRVRILAPTGGDPGFGGIASIAWSPDGRTMAFTADVDPPRFIAGTRPSIGSTASRSKTLKSPTARRIIRSDWRWDEIGHLDHWSHLFVLEMTTRARPRQVTSGDWGVGAITWHPNGRTIGFSAALGDEPDLAPFPKIWAVDIDAGPRSKRSMPRLVLDAPGGATKPAYSPGGRWLVAAGILEPEPLDDISTGLLLGPADGSRPPIALSPELDRPFGNATDTDLTGWMVYGRYGPTWLDNQTIVAVISDRGRSLPERWVIDPQTGSPVEVPVASDRASHGPWADATTHMVALGGGVVATLGTLHGRAPELMTVDLARQASERQFASHTTFGSAWQRRFEQPEMRRLDVPGPAGPIETWIASPAGADDAPLPTIIDVHGGPLGCWAPAPHVEVILLTGAGYRVVLPNIRGSGAYGREWIRPQLGNWGGVDADDVHAVLDHVIALGLADPARLGALGLSYGGFMVNWLVATSDRFAAAISENGVTNQVSCWANSDSGPEYSRASLLGDPFTPEGVEKLWDQSPLKYVTNVNTPLLMFQAEADRRCPATDNEQFFIALRRLRRTVEYVLYPDESHTFSSSGRPDRRIDRMERMLAWFNRYL